MYNFRWIYGEDDLECVTAINKHVAETGERMISFQKNRVNEKALMPHKIKSSVYYIVAFEKVSGFQPEAVYKFKVHIPT